MSAENVNPAAEAEDAVVEVPYVSVAWRAAAPLRGGRRR